MNGAKLKKPQKGLNIINGRKVYVSKKSLLFECKKSLNRCGLRDFCDINCIYNPPIILLGNR